MDLTTRYLGLELRNPLIASAGPLTGSYDGVMKLADAGVAAVVLPSLFQEDLWGGQPPEPGKYLSLIARASANAGIPVIASMNGLTPGVWTDYATALAEAGAAAIELNVYYMADNLTFPARDAEQRCFEMFTTVKVLCSLAGTSGVETAADIAAYLLAGTDAVMSTSALLRHGPAYAAELLAGLTTWAERKGFASVAAFCGMVSDTSLPTIPGRVGYLLAMDPK